MEIPVLIEPDATNGYRVRVGEPFSLCGEGKTVDEAMRSVEAQLYHRLRNGSRMLRIQLAEEHPLHRFAGSWSPEDPVIKEWTEAVEEYRRQVDESPDLP